MYNALRIAHGALHAPDLTIKAEVSDAEQLRSQKSPYLP